MVRGRRSSYELYKHELIEWIRRNKALLKGRNYYFKTFAGMWGVVTDKPLKRLAMLLDGMEVDGIRLELGKVNSDTFIHFNPPGDKQEGYWPWFPVARTVIEDAVTLALRGELLKRLDEGPRLLRLGF